MSTTTRRRRAYDRATGKTRRANEQVAALLAGLRADRQAGQRRATIVLAYAALDRRSR